MPAPPEDQFDEPEYDQALFDVVAGEFAHAPDLANPIRGLLDEHFGVEPIDLPIASDTYVPIVGVHIQNAVDEFIEAPGRSWVLHGVALPTAPTAHAINLDKLLSSPTLSLPPATIAAPEYAREQEHVVRRSVLRRGLYLVRDDEGPLAIWISPANQYRLVEVMAPSRERAARVIDEFRQASYRLNPFKGQALTITIDCPGNVLPVYLPRPSDVSADDVVLPKGLLERIEAAAMTSPNSSRSLAAAGHSLKRGLLLHGRPGTGKTHTIRYLISKMPAHTVLIVPAARMELMTDRLAEIVPYVTPGMIIFDDVDLIAEDRSRWETNDNRGPLFSLLELMDGIGVEGDVLFILATNMMERLDEAITRPGRVDQAIEVPAPDRVCRRRLFELYAAGVNTSIERMDLIVDRTEGVTGSFMSELVRRAAVIAIVEGDEDEDWDEPDDDNWDDFRPDAVDDDVSQFCASAHSPPSGGSALHESVGHVGRDLALPPDVVVTDAHVHQALDQLLDPDDPLTAQLTGAPPPIPTPTIGQLAATLQRREN